MQPLPVDPYVSEIRRLLATHRRLVVTAPPGSGKSTRVPPALVDAGRVVLLQPRRVAARSLARRIAWERTWDIGGEVGWHIRFERRFTKDTKLIVATEGILVRRLISDPLLSDTATVILDEFHERSVHADMSIALVRQALSARDDLRVVVMSATLDAERVASYLGDAPVVSIPGGLHPVEIEWRPGLAVDAAVRSELSLSRGDVLCFLPGAREIRAAADRLSNLPREIEIHELHGSLDVEAQEAALVPSTRRKVILATNIAETSLTVEGVDTVIDTGLHRVLRFERSVGIDRLQTERIPADSADQRAGRAGRTGPGRAVRLWDPRSEMRPHREPEVHRIDLAGTLLDILAWGDEPESFAWFDAPATDRIEEDLRLLAGLGAIRDGRLTETGRALQRLTVHPRLGRVLLSATDRKAAAVLCAVISDGDRWAVRELDQEGLGADALLLIDRFDRAPRPLARLAAELESMANAVQPHAGQDTLERALLQGYPDRVARRRAGSSTRLLLASGQGAVLGGSGVTPADEFMVALDTRAGDRDRQAESIVRLASAVDPAWLEASSRETRTLLEGTRVRAVETIFHGSIPLRERPVDPDPAQAAQVLVNELRLRGLEGKEEITLRRLRLAGIEIDLDTVYAQACAGRTELPVIRLRDWIAHDARSRLEQLAPEKIGVPSGRDVPLDYRENGDVVLSIKLQELFGLAEGPRVGPDRRPVTIELLAPNGRPVQVTTDLRSFWENAYQEVRKELRGRYPKHPWPDDPWTAKPTGRTKRRS